jgi:hypothetical protein
MDNKLELYVLLCMGVWGKLIPVPNLWACHAMVTRDPLNMDNKFQLYLLLCMGVKLGILHQREIREYRVFDTRMLKGTFSF